MNDPFGYKLPTASIGHLQDIREKHKIAIDKSLRRISRVNTCLPVVLGMAQVIRASPQAVLTLWAAVVAERLGHPPDTALTLGRAVAESRRRAEAPITAFHGAPLRPVWLLGRNIMLIATEQGELRATSKGKPISAGWVHWYLVKMFGEHLAEVRAAMEAAAGSMPPDDLNQAGYQIYEGFRLDAASKPRGWRARGELMLPRIQAAAAAIAAQATPSFNDPAAAD